jgi:uncharacterized protein (DUF4415 family)
MIEKDKAIALLASDPNEGKPELGDDWFAEADAYVGTKLVRRGRPKSDNPKQPVSLRLDREVIDWFKRQGSGWQSRINDELRKAAGL